MQEAYPGTAKIARLPAGRTGSGLQRLYCRNKSDPSRSKLSSVPFRR